MSTCPFRCSPTTGRWSDRTGAGDAFAATLVAGLVSGLTLRQAMVRAPVNSMRVVQHVGSQAGLLDDVTLEALLAGHTPGYGSLGAGSRRLR